MSSGSRKAFFRERFEQLNHHSARAIHSLAQPNRSGCCARKFQRRPLDNCCIPAQHSVLSFTNKVSPFLNAVETLSTLALKWPFGFGLIGWRHFRFWCEQWWPWNTQKQSGKNQTSLWNFDNGFRLVIIRYFYSINTKYIGSSTLISTTKHQLQRWGLYYWFVYSTSWRPSFWLTRPPWQPFCAPLSASQPASRSWRVGSTSASHLSSSEDSSCELHAWTWKAWG